MKEFTQFISNKTLSALEELSSSEILSFYFPWSEIDSGSSSLLVSTLSIQLDSRKFLVISNNWADTSDEYLNYYFLEAQIATSPYNIEVKDNDVGCYTFIGNYTSLDLHGSQKVKSISVLSDNETGTTECVKYDAGILIEFVNGRKVSILRQLSISGFLELNYMSPEKAVEGLTTRVVINNDA